MVISNKKRGFSLIEALMSMLVISVFFLAATKIITQKPPKEVEIIPHGYFECYYKGGALYTHTKKGASEVPEARSANCNFQPPTGLNFINVHYISGNTYFNSPEPMFEQRIVLSSPAAITSYNPQYFSDKQTGDSLFKEAKDFYAYLNGTHSDSKILKMWKQGQTPTSALFVSW